MDLYQDQQAEIRNLKESNEWLAALLIEGRNVVRAWIAPWTWEDWAEATYPSDASEKASDIARWLDSADEVTLTEEPLSEW